MKIKDIHLYGFKSFSGETKCLLNPGITAFVGPNGSGKSNIFDALRWVFGEQSMKALRCERNEDLIHLSPDMVDETNFTEVSVIIENEDFFTQFGSEFEIKRRFYRTGESEFYLNRVKCRLQDIQALFLNSGTLTYSFLELAEIEKIIQGDTKEMFDDVSGILRYQERREQTKRRLEQTEQDLLRLEDVIGEMERSTRSLRRQARQAQIYQELREEYKTVNCAILKSEFNAIIKSAQEIQDRKVKKDMEKQAALQTLSQLEENRRVLKEKVSKIEQQRKESTVQISAIREEIAKLETDLSKSDDEVKELLITSERLVVSVREKQELLAANRKRIMENEASSSAIITDLEKKQTQTNEIRTLLDQRSADYFKLQDSIKKKEVEIAEFRLLIELDKDEITKLDSTRLNKEAIIDRIMAELKPIEGTLADLQLRHKSLQDELQQVTTEQDRITLILAEVQQQYKTKESELSSVEDELEKRKASFNELKIATDTLSHRIGQPEGIKEIKQRLSGKLSGLLRDNVEVLPGYETVIDICLGDLLSFYMLNQFDPGDIQNLPEGRIGFININQSPPAAEELLKSKGLTNLTEVVKIKSSKNVLNRFFNNYYITESIDAALQHSINFPQYGFVVKEGILFDKGKIIVQQGDIGYFKISQVLQENRTKLETLSNEIIFMSDERKRNINELDKIRVTIEEERNKILGLNIKKSELSLGINEISQQISRLNKEKSQLQSEYGSLVEEVELIERQTHDFNNKKNTSSNAIAAALKEQEKLVAETTRLKEEIEMQNGRANEILLDSSVLKERHTSIIHTIEALLGDNKNIEQEIARIQTDTTSQRLSEIQDNINQTKRTLSIKKQSLAELEFTSPDRLIEDLTQAQETLYEKLTSAQKLVEETQNEMMKLDFESFQLSYRKEELVKKTREEYNTDLESYTFEDIRDLETKQKEIRERLEKLGEINPLSLQAYEQEKKRLDEFFVQRNDIIAAKQSLLKSIDELDQRARERFVTTFNEVKDKFNIVFSNFFEGGEADLVLSDPANPLTSNVQIIVRMKGKRVKTINQLSGGERTLLAVSLLLAFYLVKPAPFCILDEIDAPLDDANVVRFNKFLRDLSQRTQVVIITHNRATMEYADYLYGLTMEKPGQSKIVSVRLADLEKIDAGE